MSRFRRPTLWCDANDGECGAWDIDAYEETVSTIDGIPITSEQRAIGWTSTPEGEDFCLEHKPVIPPATPTPPTAAAGEGERGVGHVGLGVGEA